LKRLGVLLVVLVLVFAACGGRAADPAEEDNGLAALEETGGGAGANANDGGGDDSGRKPKPGNKGSGQSKKPPPKDKSSDPESSDDDDSAPQGDAPAGSGGKSKDKQAPRSATAAAAVPIPGGTHPYDTDGSSTVSGNERRMPKTTTLSARAPRGEEQTQIRDLRDSEGNGTVVETRLLYRKEGVYLTYVKISATFPGGFTDVRELQPAKPELIAPTGAQPGQSASFTMQGSGTRAEVDVRAKRVEDVAVGGTTVQTLVVDTKIVFSGAIEGQQVSTTWFWGKHVLAVREAVATDVTSGPISFQSQYQALLTKLP
jgi:hypothetical protein